MPTRSATTAWTGGLNDGSGRVEFTSSGLGAFDVSFPKRTNEATDSQVTTPEELIAAAHSSCYSMALAGEIGRAGGTPVSSSVKADVTLDTSEGLTIKSVHLTVRGQVDGLDEAGFRAVAEAAKAGCPVSRALAGVEISVDAALG